MQSRRRRQKLFSANGFVQRSGFCVGRRAQFFFKQARAFLILPQRRRVLPGPRIQLHQLAMRRLVQCVERQPAPRIGNRRFVLRPIGMPPDQVLQCFGQQVTQPLGFKELPLVEFGTVGQAEARHEISVVKIHRGLQGGGALRTQMPVRVRVLVHRRYAGLKGVDI